MNTNTIINSIHKALDEELQVGGYYYPKSFGLYKGRTIGEFDGSHVFSFMASPATLANGTDSNAATMPTTRVLAPCGHSRAAVDAAGKTCGRASFNFTALDGRRLANPK